jgi:hypothetical protein
MKSDRLDRCGSADASLPYEEGVVEAAPGIAGRVVLAVVVAVSSGTSVMVIGAPVTASVDDADEDALLPSPVWPARIASSWAFVMHVLAPVLSATQR